MHYWSSAQSYLALSGPCGRCELGSVLRLNRYREDDHIPAPSPATLRMSLSGKNPCSSDLHIIYCPAINKGLRTEAQHTCDHESFPPFYCSRNRLPGTLRELWANNIRFQPLAAKTGTALSHPDSHSTSDIAADSVPRGRFPKARVPWLPHATKIILPIRFPCYQAYPPCYATMGIVGSIPPEGPIGTVVNR